ncbi:MAG: Hpt domain-containing protein, partial [Thalassolituus sp.]
SVAEVAIADSGDVSEESVAETSEEILAEQVDSDDEDDMILDIFLEEADEISEVIEGILQKWENSPDDLLPVAELQRELHTLKGGARMAELSDVADLCHELETLYERLNDGVIDASQYTLPMVQKAHDLLAMQLQAVRRGDSAASPAAMIEELRSAASIAAPVADTESFEGANDSPQPEEIQSESADESDREIVGIFLEEAGELMEALDEAIESWRADTSSRGGANEILRVLHTLKGGARLAGLSAIGDLTHNFESDVQKALDRNARFDETFFGHLLQRQEALQTRIDEVDRLLDSDGLLILGEKELVVDQPVQVDDDFIDAEESSASDTEAQEETIPDAPVLSVVDKDNVAAMMETSAAPLLATPSLPGKEIEESRPQSVPAMAQQRKAPTELVKVSADLLDSLVNLAGETAIGRGRLEEQVSDFSGTLGEMDQTLDRMRDQLRRLDMETEAQVLFRQERHGPAYEDFDPLEMDRYSAMQQLSRALMESASDLIDLKETLTQKTRDAETLLLQQSRVNTELQEGLMKTRMVPFQRMVPRLRRIVRQVSLELNKQVELRVNNADGEMDRT